MIFFLVCPLCNEEWSSKGADDPDTNGCEIDDFECPLCGWGEPTVRSSEYDDDEIF